MDLFSWDVIRKGISVWVTHEVCVGHVYDSLISCLVNNFTELDNPCFSIASKTLGSRTMVDELRKIVEFLKGDEVLEIAKK
ncbi:MAG: hypothetical protein F6K11_14235 [Leptolyngbya sp. SIO3F4]|nr:hypothetical protein [Leptolyngbya sp. SIO3F4]